MKISLNRRTRLLAGVVVLAAMAGAVQAAEAGSDVSARVQWDIVLLQG